MVSKCELADARLQKLKEEIELRKQKRQQQAQQPKKPKQPLDDSQHEGESKNESPQTKKRKQSQDESLHDEEWSGKPQTKKTKRSQDHHTEDSSFGQDTSDSWKTDKMKSQSVTADTERTDADSEDRDTEHKKSKSKKKKKVSLGNVSLSEKSETEVPEDIQEENKEKDDESGAVVDDGADTVAGYTVLGNFFNKETAPLKHKLPEWLKNPLLIKQKKLTRPTEEEKEKDDCEAMKLLSPDLKQKLQDEGINHLFPVQREFIPVIWEDLKFGILGGTNGFRPRDVCVSTPTGSGKTLAFVLPIVQALKDMMLSHIYAVVLLPVRDLAEQVYNVFCKYCAGTKLKVGLAVGKTTFSKEQESLVRPRYPGQYHSLVSILVATPGRLVDHIRQTPGFDLSCLRFLVIDEADKMMEMKNDWMSVVESAAYSECPKAYYSMPRQRPGPVTLSSARCSGMPLQKLLFSATLSHNPERLEELNLFMPRLMTSGMVSGGSETVSSIPIQSEEAMEQDEVAQESSIGKFTTPQGLKEYVVATTPSEKPLVLLHLLHKCNFTQVLCFTNTVETTHRLFKLVQLYGGLQVAELSSNLHPDKRKKILRKFAAGKIQVLVCSDSMARGMDLPNVECVISYENPRDSSTYIHRVGRTARAEKSGTAYTLLEKKEFFHFKSEMRTTGKWSNIKEEKIHHRVLEPLVERYTNDVLPKLKENLQNENKKMHR